MSSREVACGVMYNSENKVLIGLRRDCNVWEFPGGKREGEETIQDCLRREWLEELNLEVEVKREVCSYNSACTKYMCRFFMGRILDDTKLEVRVHESVKYVDVSELSGIRLYPEDYQLIEYLKAWC